jgi:hypothetical protein
MSEFYSRFGRYGEEQIPLPLPEIEQNSSIFQLIDKLLYQLNYTGCL